MMCKIKEKTAGRIEPERHNDYYDAIDDDPLAQRQVSLFPGDIEIQVM